MRRPLFCVCVGLVALVAVLTLVGFWQEPEAPPDGTTVYVTGQICDKDDQSFTIKIQSFQVSSSPTSNQAAASQQFSTVDISELAGSNHCRKLQCQYDGPDVLIGTRVCVLGKFYSFPHATNPGEFDSANYYTSMGYVGKLRKVQMDMGPGDAVQAGASKRKIHVTKVSLGEILYKLRTYWKRRLYTILPEKEGSVMAAILLGEKSDVDSTVRDLYKRNGMIHILSISGLHITIIGLGVFKLLRKAGMPLRPAAVCGGVVLCLYGMMTGFGVSVCRAIGMYLLRMLSHLWGRTYDMLTALGVVAAAMVLWRPARIGEMGYLLSFGSVVGVGLFLPALEKTADEVSERWKEYLAMHVNQYIENPVGRKIQEFVRLLRGMLWEGFLAGLSITLTTLPIQLWFQYEISIYSVLLNALVLPLMSVVIIVGLVAMLVPGMGMVSLVDVLILGGYERICRIFLMLPGVNWNPGRPEVWQIVAYYLLWGIIVWVVPWGVKIGPRRWQGNPESAIRFVLLPVMLLLLTAPYRRYDQVTFLNVGQGDCMVVQCSTGEVYLFDCGSSSNSHVGEKILVPFLKFHGIHQIDAVFVSHGDMDHMNGLVEFFAMAEEERIAVKQVVLPVRGEPQASAGIRVIQDEFGDLIAAAGTAGIAVRTMKAGDSFCTDGNDSFYCLNPSQNSCDDRNAGSLCFYVELRERGKRLTLLLTGDVEGRGEQQMLSELDAIGAEEISVLKVAHHGSKYSTSEELFEQLHPRIAIISAGKNNQYGHPHKETLDKLKEAGIVVYRTDESGAIEVKEKGVKLNIVSDRMQK